jgi:hypothetical protein
MLRDSSQRPTTTDNDKQGGKTHSPELGGRDDGRAPSACGPGATFSNVPEGYRRSPSNEG